MTIAPPESLQDARWQRLAHEHRLYRDGELLAVIRLDVPERWDGVYRWNVVGAAQRGLAATLRQARAAVYAALDSGAAQESLFEPRVVRPPTLYPLPHWCTEPSLNPAQARWLAHASPAAAAAFLSRGPAHSRLRRSHGHDEFLPCLRGVVVGPPQASETEALALAQAALEERRLQVERTQCVVDECALGIDDASWNFTRRLAELGGGVDRVLPLGPLLASIEHSMPALDSAIEALATFDPSRENLRALSQAIPFPAGMTRVVSKMPQRWLLDHAMDLGLQGCLGRAFASPPRRILQQRASKCPPPIRRWFYDDDVAGIARQAIAWIERARDLELS
jgi:hypothetical protein